MFSSNKVDHHLSWPNPPITAEPKIVTWIFRTWGTPTVDVFTTVHNTHLPQFMSSVSESPPFPRLANQSETQDHPGGRSNTNSLPGGLTTVVSTSNMSLSGPPSLLSIPPGPTVTTRICLDGKCSHAALPSKRSLDSRQPLEDPQQTECMTTGGFASLTGPQDKELICLTG